MIAKKGNGKNKGHFAPLGAWRCVPFLGAGVGGGDSDCLAVANTRGAGVAWWFWLFMIDFVNDWQGVGLPFALGLIYILLLSFSKYYYYI